MSYPTLFFERRENELIVDAIGATDDEIEICSLLISSIGLIRIADFFNGEPCLPIHPNNQSHKYTIQFSLLFSSPQNLAHYLDLLYEL